MSMAFDLTTIIIILIVVFLFWSTLRLLKNNLNNIMHKTLTLVDATVTVNSTEMHLELTERMNKATAELAQLGVVNYNEKYEELFGKPK